MKSTGLFGTPTRTSTVLVIHLLEETHASEIAAILGKSLSRIQDAIRSLEEAGLIVVHDVGRARRIRLNPRFPAIKELEALLSRLGIMDIELQKRLAERRRRPRKTGKAI